ncbi:hypothetical protein N7478_001975 [Penicillium angulare]|uniref:uncharacterized protein n=1 Tax=Penicillium angulare TaxID=116970 RepID=UPI00253FD102|nr:uncharacterized protein N7478_001975 [Penicillium angulare]KAJ5288945.1 hypothetical protein N7478_001975 [Penicillium angulare]
MAWEIRNLIQSRVPRSKLLLLCLITFKLHLQFTSLPDLNPTDLVYSQTEIPSHEFSFNPSNLSDSVADIFASILAPKTIEVQVADHNSIHPRIYLPKPDANKIVRQTTTPVGSYFSLFRVTELVSVEWTKEGSLENESYAIKIEKRPIQTGLTVTSGKANADSVSGSSSFAGWEFSYSADGKKETKAFNIVETSSVQTKEVESEVPPHSSVFVYRKKFTFRCKA